MDKTIPIEVPEEEAAQMQAEIRYLFEEIERANERMKKDQEEIVRSKTRTRAMLVELAAMRNA